MYHVDMYTYNDNYVIRGKDFSVHKLNDPGETKFLGPDSHNVNYVSRINPKVFKNITGTDYESIMKEQEEKISLKNRTDSCPQKPAVKFDEKIDYPEDKTLKNIDNNTYNQTQKEEQFQKNQNDDYIEEGKTKKFSKTVNINPEFNVFNSQGNMNRTYQGGFFGQRFKPRYHRKRNFKETYGYDNPGRLGNKEQLCSYELKELKKDKLANDEFNSDFNFKRKYNGFTSYEIPRICKNDIEVNCARPFGIYTNKLKKSLSCACIKNQGSGDIDTLKKDNQFMKNTVSYQTNPNFLAQHKLPDIPKLANSRKKIRNLFGTSSKHYLGESFDPYTYICPNRNRTATNWVGALFQH